MWAPEVEPRGGDQPVPQWDVLAPLPPPAPGLGPSLHPCGSHLHRQVHSWAVPECAGTVCAWFIFLSSSQPWKTFFLLSQCVLFICSLQDNLSYCECQVQFPALSSPLFKRGCEFVHVTMTAVDIMWLCTFHRIHLLSSNFKPFQKLNFVDSKPSEGA